MIVAAMILAPVILLAAGSLARDPRLGRALSVTGLVMLACVIALASLALPIGGSVEEGATPVTVIEKNTP